MKAFEQKNPNDALEVDTVHPSASPPPNPFDPASLRIDLVQNIDLGVKKALVRVAVRKPSRQEFRPRLRRSGLPHDDGDLGVEGGARDLRGHARDRQCVAWRGPPRGFAPLRFAVGHDLLVASAAPHA